MRCWVKFLRVSSFCVDWCASITSPVWVLDSFSNFNVLIASCFLSSLCVCSDSGRGSSLLDRAVADRRQLNAMTLPDFSDPETGERSHTHKLISTYLYLYSYGGNSPQRTSALLSFYLYFLHMYLSLSLSNTQIWFRVNGLMRWLVDTLCNILLFFVFLML